MKHSALVAALLALSLTACGEKPATETPAAPVAAPVVAPAPEAAPTDAASAPAPAAPEAMDSMKK